MPLKAGAPLDRALLQASREAAIDELKDHGYPNPDVSVAEAPGSSERQRIITYSAQPGRLAYVGRTSKSSACRASTSESSGASSHSGAGSSFEQSKLRESQRRLYAMELFNFVNVESVRSRHRGTEAAVAGQPRSRGKPRSPTNRPIDRHRVTVTEGKHRKVNFGVGYGTEEKVRGEVDWRHVNFFGGARTAGVFARYSALDRGVRLNFRQPYFFSPRYSFGMSGQSWFSDEPAYKLTTIGGRVTVAREFTRARSVLGSRQTSVLALTYANEWEDYTISDEALNDPTFRDELIALGLDPRDGVRPRPALGAAARRRPQHDRQPPRCEEGLPREHPLRDGRTVARRRLRLSRSVGRGPLLPVARHSRGRRRPRRRAGSIDSIGTGREPRPVLQALLPRRRDEPARMGPVRGVAAQRRGLPIGGHTFMNFSTELRLPIVGKFGAVLFLDGGNVWTNPWDFNLNDLRYDVGLGPPLQHADRPVRLDAGWQLNPIPGLLVNGEPQTRAMRIHFSIGQAF